MKNRVRHPRHRSGLRARLHLEQLETRIVPYTTVGGSWIYPQLITISFEPDGTDLGGVSSNLFATLNAHRGWTTATWQNQILKAAQVWAQQTNVNFAVVSDNGTGIGGGLFQQGDPGMGDIRIGGFNFGSSDLAGADYPQPINNYSIAGDIAFNTGVGWNIGSTYDLYTVAMHEFGHALGMGESTVNAVMQGAYFGTRSGLTSDDIAGIRSIYSSGNARSYDSYYSANPPNNSFATAANVNSLVTSLTGVVSGLDITTTSESEYFTFNVPLLSQSSFTVSVQSKGLSMLAPKMTVYNSSQTALATVSGLGQYGTTISYTVTGASVGQQYYVKVSGADTSAFGTGAYALTLNFGTGLPPIVLGPNTQVLDGFPINSGGGDPERAADSASETASSTPARATATVLVISSAASVSAQPPAIVALPALPVSSSVTTAAPPSTAAPAHAAATIESGSSQADTQPGFDGFDESMPPVSDADSVSTLPLAPAGNDVVVATTDKASWRDASTAAFAADNAAPAKSGAATSPQPVETGSPTDQASMAACLVVMLGSYWYKAPEPSSQLKRRPTRIRRG
ncbi:MAG TPA: matrixin family metalloprotease [Gemmataceae bacterium]|nr:matrixin family metalloprotease [Gemmataceae bacterium]